MVLGQVLSLLWVAISKKQGYLKYISPEL